MSDNKKRAVVTGATDGIGKQIALGLARRGHEIVIIGRDAEKGHRAERELREVSGNADVSFMSCDVSVVTEARRLTEEIACRWDELHFLVHCAGIVRGHYSLTAEGIEANFATNYLSRFFLTTRWLPLLDASARDGSAARVVIVGGAATNGRVHFDDVNLTRSFTTPRAVLQFCRANDLFTLELASRLAVAGASPRVTIVSLKVGVVKTHIRREFPWWMKALVPLLDPLVGQTPERVAASALRLLEDKAMEGVTGALFVQVREFKRLALSARLLDPDARQRLWELSEHLVERALGEAVAAH